MVIWSEPAKEDLKKIFDYIASDSKYYAIKVSQEFVEKSEQLEKLPMIGRIVPELEDSNIRELIIYSYRFVYEISHKKIEILAIIHGKQDFYRAFDKSKKKETDSN
jgi:toxin ParE1/3/4